MAKKKSKPVEQQLDMESSVVEDSVVEEAVIEEPTVEETRTGTVIKCQCLNVRKEPKAGAKVVATIPCGTIVEICGESSDFYSVSLSNNISGFCMKKFIKTP